MSRIKCNVKTKFRKIRSREKCKYPLIMTFIKIVFNLKIEFDPQYNSNDSKKPCLDTKFGRFQL